MTSIIRFFTLFSYLFILFSCNRTSKPFYENQADLEKIVMQQTDIDLRGKGNNVIIVLNEADCICTKENVKLSKDLVNNQKYKKYQFIVFVKGRNHKFLKNMSKAELSRIHLVKDTADFLMKGGYISTTDRLITYNNGLPTKYFDMKFQKNADIRSSLNIN